MNDIIADVRAVLETADIKNGAPFAPLPLELRAFLLQLTLLSSAVTFLRRSHSDAILIREGGTLVVSVQPKRPLIKEKPSSIRPSCFNRLALVRSHDALSSIASASSGWCFIPPYVFIPITGYLFFICGGFCFSLVQPDRYTL